MYQVMWGITVGTAWRTDVSVMATINDKCGHQKGDQVKDESSINHRYGVINNQDGVEWLID